MEQMKEVKKEKKKMPLLVKILIGFIIGIVLGVVFGEKATVISPIGDAFMRLLKMLILPLVFSAIVSGITNIPDIRQMARVGIRSLILFVVMTALAIITGIIFGDIFKPGIGANIQLPVEEVTGSESVSIVDTLVNMIPNNVFESLSSDSMLQVIFFAIFFGICIILCGEKAEPVRAFFDGVAQVMYKMTDLIIACAPVGVCAMIAEIIGEYGLSALIPLAKFLVVFHIAILFFWLAVQGGLIALGLHINPLKFFKAIAGSISMAYVTDSSAAALPVALGELEKNVGVSEAIRSFVMPVGTNISKSGSALYQGIVAVFIAQVAGIDLSFAQQVTIFLTALFASLGTAGVPSASIVMLSMTLNSVGLPLQGIALMSGIDRILGGARTFPNVVTNAAISAILAKKEGEKLKF